MKETDGLKKFGNKYWDVIKFNSKITSCRTLMGYKPNRIIKLLGKKR